MQSQICELRNKIILKEFNRMNDMQLKAVLSVDGPLLILAGAGSGKTTVLVNRIANLMKYGCAYNSNIIEKRYDENILKGINTPLEELEKEIAHRDYLDMNKGYGSLKKADDAIELDTSYMSIEEVVDFIYNKALELM